MNLLRGLLTLTIGFTLVGCTGDDSTSTRQMAGQPVCLKVCVGTQSTFCETYCPPADSCKLVCDTNAVVAGTTDPTSTTGGTDPAKKPTGGLCQWSCPSTPPGCQPVCEPQCELQLKQQNLDPQLIADKCCKSDCPPVPPTPGCTPQCDATCITNATQTGGKADLDKCCKATCPPPPPPCGEVCDQACLTSFAGNAAGSGTDADAHAKCCKSNCPTPPPAPCSQQCDPQCMTNLKQQPNVDEKLIIAKCCQSNCPPPPPSCPQQCDQSCIMQLGNGQKDPAVLAKCCKSDCSTPPAQCKPGACGPALGMPNTLCPDGKTVAGPTGQCLVRADGQCGWEVSSCPAAPCAAQCDQTCLAQLKQQNVDEQTAKAKCCSCSSTDPAQPGKP